jgi:hypothetical protein
MTLRESPMTAKNVGLGLLLAALLILPSLAHADNFVVRDLFSDESPFLAQ